MLVVRWHFVYVHAAMYDITFMGITSPPQASIHRFTTETLTLVVYGVYIIFMQPSELVHDGAGEESMTT